MEMFKVFWGIFFIIYCKLQSTQHRVISKVEVKKVERQAPSIDGSLELCYWAKSSGHNRLSRLSTEGLKSVLISWLLCTLLRFLYLLVLILITSFKYGISKSLCKVWLETYQRALLIFLSIFDWNFWFLRNDAASLATIFPHFTFSHPLDCSSFSSLTLWSPSCLCGAVCQNCSTLWICVCLPS